MSNSNKKNLGNIISQNNIFRNVLRSTKNASAEVLKDLAPSISKTLETNTEFVKEKYSSGKSVVFTDGDIKNNYVYKSAQQLIKNAINDLKTGNIYNKSRADEALGEVAKSMGFDIDMSELNYEEEFSMEDEDSDYEESSETNDSGDTTINKNMTTNKNVVINNITDNGQTLKGMGELTQHVMRNNAVGFSAIQETMSGMLNFQNENTLNFYNEMSEKVTQMTNSVTNIEKILGGMAQIQLGGIKLQQEYNNDFTELLSKEELDLNLFNDKFKKFLDEKNAKDMFGMGKGIIDSIVSNPLGMLMTTGIKKLIPNQVKSILEQLDGLFRDSHLLINDKLREFANNDSFFGADKIFEIFGSSHEAKKGFDFSQYEKGKVSFDGITRRAIVNVIPSYLSKILSAISGRDELLYDYDKGSFTTKRAVREQFNEELKAEKHNVKINSYKQEILKRNNKENDQEFQNKLEKAFDNIIEKQISITDNIDKSSLSDNSEVANAIYELFTNRTFKQRRMDRRNIAEALEDRNKIYQFIERNESYHNAFDYNSKNKIFKKDRSRISMDQEDINNILYHTNNLELNGEYEEKLDDVLSKIFFNKKIENQNINPNKFATSISSITTNILSAQQRLSEGDNISEVLKDVKNNIKNRKIVKVKDIVNNIGDYEEDDEFDYGDDTFSLKLSGKSSNSNKKSKGVNNKLLKEISNNVLKIINILENKSENNSSRINNNELDLFKENNKILSSINNKLDYLNKLDKLDNIATNTENILNSYAEVNSMKLKRSGIKLPNIKFGRSSRDEDDDKQGIFSIIGGKIKGINSKVKERIKKITSFFSNPLGIFEDKMKFINDKLKDTINSFKQVGGKIFKEFKGFLNKTVDVLGKVGDRLLSFTEKTLPTFLNFIQTSAKGIFSAAKDIAGGIWRGIKSGANKASDMISNITGRKFGKFRENYSSKEVVIKGGFLDYIKEPSPVYISLSPEQERQQRLKRLDDADKEEKLENEQNSLLNYQKNKDKRERMMGLAKQNMQRVKDKIFDIAGKLFGLGEGETFLSRGTGIFRNAIAGGANKLLNTKLGKTKLGSKVLGMVSKLGTNINPAAVAAAEQAGATPVVIVGGGIDGINDKGGLLDVLKGKGPSGKGFFSRITNGITGKLGKFGSKLGNIGKVAGKLGKFGKLVPGIGAALTAATSLGQGLSGWNNAGSIFGTQDATLGQKLAGATGGILNNLSFGLLDETSSAQSIYKFFGGGKNSQQSEYMRSVTRGSEPLQAENNSTEVKEKRSMSDMLWSMTPMGMASNLGKNINKFIMSEDGKKIMKNFGNFAKTMFYMSPIGLAYGLGKKIFNKSSDVDGNNESFFDKLFNKGNSRRKRSTTNWFTKVGDSVKGFFGKIFGKDDSSSGGGTNPSDISNDGSNSVGYTGVFKYPVPDRNTRISSPYGYRIHPVTGQKKMHKGIDLAAPLGTPVFASASGVASLKKNPSGYGNYITITHSNGLMTRYAHLHKFNIKDGETVSAGQQIGEVGSTGMSTGPHLHYEVLENEKQVDPMPYLNGEKSISSGSVDDIFRLSAKYETGSSNGNPGQISNNKGDYGGKSYGVPQFSIKTGSLGSFVNSLKDTNKDWYDRLTQHKLGSSGFDAVWKQIASESPEAFKEAQHNRVISQFYHPAVKKIKSVTGIDVESRSSALRAAVYSTAVQHGPGSNVFRNAWGTNSKNDSDPNLLTKLYNERGAGNGSKYFPKSSPSIQRSVAKRFKNELQDALKMYEEEMATKNSGRSIATASTRSVLGEPSETSPLETFSKTLAKSNSVESSSSVSTYNSNSATSTKNIEKYSGIQKLLKDLVTLNKENNDGVHEGNRLLMQMLSVLIDMNNSGQNSKLQINNTSGISPFSSNNSIPMNIMNDGSIDLIASGI